MRILANEDVELCLVHLHQLGLLESNHGRRPCRWLEESHFAEQLLLAQHVNGVAADHDRNLASLDGEHAVAFVALLEDRRTDRKQSGIRRVPEEPELPSDGAHEGDGLPRASRRLAPRLPVGVKALDEVLRYAPEDPSAE